MTDKEVSEIRGRLLKENPRFFKNYFYSVKKGVPCELYLGIGDGWLPIVERTANQIEELSRNTPSCPMAASTIKEKFGGLRIYLDSSTEEAERIVDEAEEESFRTCEECGTTEDVGRTKGWFKTLCRKCADKLKAKAPFIAGWISLEDIEKQNYKEEKPTKFEY